MAERGRSDWRGLMMAERGMIGVGPGMGILSEGFLA